MNPRLVRGLDYYSRTVFEWITDALGSQDAVCSGGRYDGLIAQMGGEATPAIGFAMGVERVVELVRLAGHGAAGRSRRTCSSWPRARRPSAAALALAEQLRDAFPGRGVVVHCGSAKFKTQFRRADESGARLALIVGDDELARGVVALKPLRGAETTQTEYPVAELDARGSTSFSGDRRERLQRRGTMGTSQGMAQGELVDLHRRRHARIGARRPVRLALVRRTAQNAQAETASARYEELIDAFHAQRRARAA